jgi:hypothetical protein
VKRRCLAFTFLTVIIMIMLHSVAHAETDLSKWSHRASIEIKPTPEAGLVQVALSPEILDRAKPDLSDLRVVDAGGAEIGYVLRMAQRKTASTPLPTKLYNRTHLPGQHSAVTVEFGSKIIKNNITIHTNGTAFKRRVQVEGSDDGVTWEIVRKGALLFRVQKEARKQAMVDSKSVDLPENDWQYLRVTVFNDPEDAEAVEIDDVKASRKVTTPAQTVDVPVKSVSIKDKDRCTEIYLDLAYRNLPLSEVSLRFSNPNFFREVSVLGRNEETILVRTPVEDSPALEKRLPAPWKPIMKRAIFRYTGGGADEQSTSLNLTRARYRYLLIRIENRDDPPLSFEAATVTRLTRTIAFQPKQKADGFGDFFLYFGNAQAQAPVYDVGRYIDRTGRKVTEQSRFLGIEKNPAYVAAEKVLPWSERHQGIIWVALLVMAAVLTLLVYKLARSTAKTSQ